MKKSERVLYYLDNIDIDNIVASHIAYLKEKDKPSNINKDILSIKYQFLLHIICLRTSSSKRGIATLNASVLKSLFDLVYKDMLHVLCNVGVIDTNWQYEMLKKAREFELCETYKSAILTKSTNHLKLLAYMSDMDSLLDNNHEKRKPKEESKLIENSEWIYDVYNANLRKLRISNEAELDEYINQRDYLSINQSNYYKSIYNYYLYDYDKFRITSIDNNKRIYSILTSTPRYIKNFINILFSIDISNSHPLLFNYYLIKYYKLDISLLHKYYKYIFNINTNHFYDVDNIYNVLNINDIQKQQIAKIPQDVWLYIAKTSKGQFWDDFKDCFVEYGLNRIDVKVTLFQEVFYSHSTKSHGKIFAKQFKSIYPSVYVLLSKYKEYKRLHRFDEADQATNRVDKAIKTQKAIKESFHFANNMMELESTIFQKILTKLYKKRGCCALSIHDAIIMVDTKGSRKYTEEDIIRIMKLVYKEYNLCPTFSVERYDPIKWREELEQEKKNRPLIDARIAHLKQSVDDGDKTSEGLLNMLDSGLAEIAFDHNGEMYYHRLFDHKVRHAQTRKNYDILQKGNKKLSKDQNKK